MSRSRKHPVHTLTNQIDKSKAHKRVRKHVKQALRNMDFDDPDSLIIDIEADTRSIGAEEFGTKFGYDFMDDLSEEERAELEEDKRKASRK
jgi:hypothetical protein